MRYIDVRSDTVTQPTEKMRQAMAQALVGDDVYLDDPTVNELEALAAQLVGKEAALFLPTGTMGNQCAIMTHTRRGEEIIAEASSHIVTSEVGGAAVLSGVSTRTISGIIYPHLLEAAIQTENVHHPDTGLLCLENPSFRGTLIPLEVMKADYEIAHAHGFPVHLDGARVFNAAIAMGVDVKEITQYCDSVMFCISKGLCAPVGSMLAGSKAFIDKARRVRKLLGGGMRQAGILAAAGIIALTDMVKCLETDHQNAKYLAGCLAEIPGVSVNLEDVQINMVFLTVDRPAQLLAQLPEKMRERGIKISPATGKTFRFMTNHDVSREDLDQVVDTFSQLIG